MASEKREEATMESGSTSAPSIHDIEASLKLGELPPADRDDRALFIERVLPASVTLKRYARAEYDTLASTAGVAMPFEVGSGPDLAEITLRAPGHWMTKRIRFFPDGAVKVKFSWDPSTFPDDAWFTTELSLSRPHALKTDPGAEVWEHPIETVAKSERGLDRTLQGTAYLIRWPVRTGAADVELSERNQI